jgi:hypothetical protein
VAILVLAPVAAAAVIALLLLLGVPPHLVFLPGHALMAGLTALGFHVHNRVGVLATVFCWWVLIVLAGWIRWSGRAAPSSRAG